MAVGRRRARAEDAVIRCVFSVKDPGLSGQLLGGFSTLLAAGSGTRRRPRGGLVSES